MDAESNLADYVRGLNAQHAAPFMREYKRRVRELLALVPGLRVLDIGCGTGVDALEVARRVAPNGEVVGLDFSQTMAASVSPPSTAP